MDRVYIFGSGLYFIAVRPKNIENTTEKNSFKRRSGDQFKGRTASSSQTYETRVHCSFVGCEIIVAIQVLD